MTKDDIIRIAREQGLPETATEGVFIVNSDDIGRLLAAEREACAQTCEQAGIDGYGTLAAAALIRKRGEE